MGRARSWMTMIALVSTGTLPPVGAHAQAPADTARLSQLLTALRDTTPSVAAAATAALRADAPVYLPHLERLIVGGDHFKRFAAGKAMALIGEPAYPALRRAIVATATGSMLDAEMSVGAIESAADLLVLLDPLLSSASPAERAAAVSALNPYREDAELFGDAILGALGDSSETVRNAALGLHLSQIGSPAFQSGLVERLTTFLDSPDTPTRRSALYNIGNIHPYGRPAIPRILGLAESDPDEEIRWLAARVLTWQGAAAADAQPVLLRMLRDRSDTVRVEALSAMGGIGAEGLDPIQARALVDSIVIRLDSPNRWMREAAAQALLGIGEPAAPALRASLRSRDDAVATTSAVGLSLLPHLAANDRALLDALSDSRDTVREASALALVGAGSRVEPALQSLIGQSPMRRAAAARLALRLIASQRMIDVADRCFAIRYGTWTPPIPFSSIEGLLPPLRVRFRSIVASPPYEDEDATFVVEQQGDRDWFRTGMWTVDTVARTITLNASPSLSGVTITVRADGTTDLVGEASTYWDFRREREVAPVRLVGTPCTVPR